MRQGILLAAAGLAVVLFAGPATACPTRLVCPPGVTCGAGGGSAGCVTPFNPPGTPTTSGAHLGNFFTPGGFSTVGDTTVGDSPTDGQGAGVGEVPKHSLARTLLRLKFRAAVRRYKKALADEYDAYGDREILKAILKLEQEMEKHRRKPPYAARQLSILLPQAKKLSELRKEMLAKGYKVFPGHGLEESIERTTKKIEVARVQKKAAGKVVDSLEGKLYPALREHENKKAGVPKTLTPAKPPILPGIDIDEPIH